MYTDRAVALAQLSLVAAIALVSLVSSSVEPDCVIGGSPFDGQTAVAVDAVLTLVTLGIASDAPQLAGNIITLQRVASDGALVDVPFELSQRPALSTEGRSGLVAWMIRPKQPLLADTKYVLFGVKYRALESPNYQASETQWARLNGWFARLKTFSTESAPRLLAAVGRASPSKDVWRYSLVFSEPMKRAALTPSSVNVAFLAPNQPEVPLTVLVVHPSDPTLPHIVDIDVRRMPKQLANTHDVAPSAGGDTAARWVEAPGTVQISLATTVVAATGQPLPADGERGVGKMIVPTPTPAGSFSSAEHELQPFLGRTTCQ